MSESQTLLLGFIAGVTILLGLPLGRMRSPQPGTRQFLNALAVGILLFLIWDVLVHAYEPLDIALGKLHDGSGGVGPVAGYAALFFLGITVGLGSLVLYEGWLGARPGRARRRVVRRPRRRVVPEVRAGHDGAGANWPCPGRGVSPGGPRPAACPCSSRSASVCTTSAKGWPSAAAPPRRDRPGHRPGHRVRAAQRDRGVRHRGARWPPRATGPPGGSSCSWG